MDDRLRRYLTRALVVVMLATALWGAWIMAKNGGRRGRIGIPKAQEKVMHGTDSQTFVKNTANASPPFARPIAV